MCPPLAFLVPKDLIKAALRLMHNTKNADRIIFTRERAPGNGMSFLIRAEVPGSTIRHAIYEPVHPFPNWQKLVTRAQSFLSLVKLQAQQCADLTLALEVLRPVARRYRDRCGLHFGSRFQMECGDHEGVHIGHLLGGFEIDFERSINVNLSYLRDGLRFVGAESVTWAINTDPREAMRLESPGRLYMLMPIATRDVS